MNVIVCLILQFSVYHSLFMFFRVSPWILWALALLPSASVDGERVSTNFAILQNGSPQTIVLRFAEPVQNFHAACSPSAQVSLSAFDAASNPIGQNTTGRLLEMDGIPQN